MNISFINIRKELGLSRRELASALMLSPSAISNYENGFRHPELAVGYKLIAIAKEHGKTITLEDIYPQEMYMK